jgi:hypothetical protein
MAGMVVCGKHFGGEIISRIQAAVKAEPALSRRRLSRRVCQWLDWRSPNGRLQEMSCRKALAKLNRQGVLALPERSRVGELRRARPKRLEVEIPQVSCRLEELGEVTVWPVRSRHSRDSQIARALLERYHYLGCGVLRGAQMRYLVRSSRYGYLGVVTFCSGTWALKDRDNHIGWSEHARRARPFALPGL